MDGFTLGNAIQEAGCPITSVSVLDANDRSTWHFEPSPTATPEQITAAQNVIDTIDPQPLSVLSTPDWIGRFTNAEYRAATAAAWRGVAGNAKNWDVVAFRGTIDMNRKATKTLRDSLVADGIITAARATELFS